jgi:hypothetical protein
MYSEGGTQEDFGCQRCGGRLARVTAYCSYCGSIQLRAISTNQDRSASKLSRERSSLNKEVGVVRFARSSEAGVLDGDDQRDAVVAPSPGESVPAESCNDRESSDNSLKKEPSVAITTEGEPVGKKPEPIVPSESTVGVTINETNSGASPAAVIPVNKTGRRKWLIVLLTIAAVVSLLKLVPSGQLRKPAPPQISVETVYVIRDDAVLRSAPTTLGSSVTSKLARGAQLVGAWETNATGTRWLKLTRGPFKDAYIWEKNVSAAQPPPIAQAIDGYMSLTQQAELRGSPNSGARLLQVVGRGASVYVVGSVDDTWLEISLRHGGVGYLPRSAFQ